MSRDPTSKTRKGCVSVIGRGLGALVMVGVVLALWRYLGQGAGIGSPEWLDNATASIEALMGWFAEMVNELLGDVQPPDTSEFTNFSEEHS